MNDRYSHVIAILEAAVLICSMYALLGLLTNHCVSFAVCASTQKIPEPHCILFPANQVFHTFNSLLIAIYMAVIHVLNSLAPGLVPTSSLWLVTYVPSSHIYYVPQCRVNGKFVLNLLLGSPVP